VVQALSSFDSSIFFLVLVARRLGLLCYVHPGPSDGLFQTALILARAKNNIKMVKQHVLEIG
jgi:hypothetical protein